MGITPTAGKPTPPTGGQTPPAAPTPQTGGQTPPAPTGGKTSTRKAELFKAGLSKLPDELKKVEGRGQKVETLEFIKAVGLASSPSTYTDKQKDVHKCGTIIGAIFQSTEEVKVPRVPVKFTLTTGINMDEVEYETIPANTPFVLSLLDSLIFNTQPEYSSCFMYQGTPIGKFTAKFKGLDSNPDVKLPTPHYLIPSHQLKAFQEYVDEKVGGEWKIRAGYERFAPLLEKTTTNRSKGNTSTSLGTNDITSIAIREALGLN